MGSVVIIFLPILLPFILFLGIAERFGYSTNDVIMEPFEFFLNTIVTVFFGGNEELFMSTFESFVNDYLEFLTENEGTLASASEKIAELLGSIIY